MLCELPLNSECQTKDSEREAAGLERLGRPLMIHVTVMVNTVVTASRAKGARSYVSVDC